MIGQVGWEPYHGRLPCHIRYILSILNQYDYPTIPRNSGPAQQSNQERDQDSKHELNQALRYGLLHPLSQGNDGSAEKSGDLLAFLAFQLRMSTTKMIYSVAITII